MTKLDILIKSIDRLTELNEEILREIRCCGTVLPAPPSEPTNEVDVDLLDNLIDAVEVKEILKMSSSTLYRNKGGYIKPLRFGKTVRYDRREIIKLIKYFMK